MVTAVVTEVVMVVVTAVGAWTGGGGAGKVTRHTGCTNHIGSEIVRAGAMLTGVVMDVVVVALGKCFGLCDLASPNLQLEDQYLQIRSKRPKHICTFGE